MFSLMLQKNNLDGFVSAYHGSNFVNALSALVNEDRTQTVKSETRNYHGSFILVKTNNTDGDVLSAERESDSLTANSVLTMRKN